MPLMEEVVYAVTSLHLEDQVAANILTCFDINLDQYSILKDKIFENRKLPSLHVRVHSIKLRDLHPSREEGHLVCKVKLGNGPLIQADAVNPKEWTLPTLLQVDNLQLDKLDIEIWHENDKSSRRDNSFIARSLDTIGRKLKTSLGSPSQSEKEHNNNLDGTLDGFDSPAKTDYLKSKRSSLNLRDNKWISGAISTLTRQKRQTDRQIRDNEFTNHKSDEDSDTNFRCFDHKWNDQDRFVDMDSSILNNSDNSSSNESKKLTENVIEKPEVEVKRQFLKTGSVGALDRFAKFMSAVQSSDYLSSLESNNQSSIATHKKLLPTASLPEKDTSPTSGFIRSKTVGRFQTIKSATQIWNRTCSSNSDTDNKIQKHKRRKEEPFDILSPVLSLADKTFLFRSFSRDRIGAASIEIFESFLKMKCCRWSLVVNNILKTERKPENVFISPESISLSIEIIMEEIPVQINPATIFEPVIRTILEKDNDVIIDLDEDKEFGMFLPLTKESKIILKCLVFSLNISELYFTYGAWRALINHQSLLNTSQHSREFNLTNTGTTQSPGIRRLHPHFLFHWLTKIETVLFSLGLDDDEMYDLALSFKDLIEEDFKFMFSRLHSSFALSRSTHLQYTLRIVQLMSESRNIYKLLEDCDFLVYKDWSKQEILMAVESHVLKWSKALSEEYSLKDSPNEDSESTENVVAFANFLEVIRCCEQALLCINDFIILAEKVYEPMFQSEINESYLKSVWKEIHVLVMKFLEPIWVNQQKLEKSSFPIQNFLEIHASVWILVLQLSKLQRFENAEGRWDVLKYRLPSKFQEIFSFLICLWFDICFSKMDESLRIEMKVETLETTNESCPLSSSAIELIEKFEVFQEKVSSLYLPSDKEISERIIEHLYDKLSSLLDYYQSEICHIAIARSTVKHAISPQISLSIFNLKRVTNEAERLLASIVPKGCKSNYIFEQIVRKAAYSMFSQCLPRLSARISNVLIKHDMKCSTIVSNWMKTFVNSISDVLPSATSTLQYFWDFLLIIISKEEKNLVKIKELQYLGELVENIYLFYKSIQIQIFEKSEKDFQSLMDIIKLRTSSTADLILMFYNQRFQEQKTQIISTQSRIIVNVHMRRGKGLSIEVHMGPHIREENPNFRRRSSWIQSKISPLKLTSKKSDNSATDESNGQSRASKAMQPVVNLISKFDFCTGKTPAPSEYYVKVKLEPNDWFKGSNEKRSRKDRRNPPVFDSEMLFSKVRPESEGIRKGGFAVIRLKSGTSEVIGEALVPLKDIPLVSTDERRKINHSYLALTKPSAVQEYPSLLELTKRSEDKIASQFLCGLENSYFYLS